MDPMKKNLYNYPFPNAVCIFWYFASPMFLFLLSLIIYYHRVVFAKGLINLENIKLILSFLFSLTIMPSVAYVVANLYPSVRLDQNGLEIQIYFPLMTKWLFIPWEDVETIKIYVEPSTSLFGRGKKWIFVQSEKLPFIYLLLTLFFKQTTKRGFTITHRIRGYDQLLDFFLKKGSVRA